MIKHNAYYELFASMTVPNHEEVGYWVDLAANSKGKIIKVFNKDINKWVILVDESRQDYVPPFIGSNGNWWIDNRDTGVRAIAESPYIGENKNWYTYDPINKKYVDTGIIAEGLNAYQIAVKNGFVGSENEWVKSLSEASENAAVIALDAANKANEATDKALEATAVMTELVDNAEVAIDKAEELSQNPPKIVNNEWWIYQYETKEYVNTGISAIGDAFTYKKEYASIADMEADWTGTDVEIGEYVLINTGDVNDEDDAKVYLKTLQGWKFIVDLSGMQGIQGWSAYEVAVQNGFVGTEEDWLQSLKQASLDAAKEALSAKTKVEATEQDVKEAESLRVIAEQNRVNAEDTRIANENTRIDNENARKLAETNRNTAENQRAASENTRETNEAARENATAQAISDVNAAKSATETATANAITATNAANTAASKANTSATNADTQANRAKEYADNPPKIESEYWHTWDEVNDKYVNTGNKSIADITVTTKDLEHDQNAYVTKTGDTNTFNLEFGIPAGDPGVVFSDNVPPEDTKATIWVRTDDDYDIPVYSKDECDARFQVKGGQGDIDYTGLEDIYTYGVEWDTTVADPDCTRIGNPLLHKSLPVQSQYRGCITQGDEIMYFLDPNDWSKKADGSPSRLDGYDGVVRVFVPKFYGKSGSNGTKRWVRISTVRIDATWQVIPEMLVDAYKCTVLNRVPENMGYLSTLPVNSAISVMNTSDYCRGGGNRASYDKYFSEDNHRSDLGKPRSSISRATMRTYAANSGSEILCYEYYKWVFYWSAIIEYATFNIQKAFVPELTSDGYHQGGLGSGITNMSYWAEYNNTYSVQKCGYTNSIGNFSGEVIMPQEDFIFDKPSDANAKNGYKIDTNAAVATFSGDTATITEVKKANARYMYTPYHLSNGTVTYTIAGLVDGQTVEFVTNNKTIASASTNGDIVVIWPEEEKTERQFRSLFTGVCSITITIKTLELTESSLSRNPLQAMRWRGFENPFGDIWHNLDGIVLQRLEPNADSYVYTTTDVNDFTDVIGEKDIAGIEKSQEGYIKEFDLGEEGDIIPNEISGGYNMYKCDYHHANSSVTFFRAFFVGGSAHSGRWAGFGYSDSLYSVSYLTTHIGFRTLTRRK